MSTQEHIIELDIDAMMGCHNSISQKFRVETYNDEICGLSLLVDDEEGNQNAINVDLWLLKLEPLILEVMEQTR